MNLAHLVFALLFYLAAGTTFSLGFVRPSEVGRRYFIYHGLGAVGLALGSFFLLGRDSVSPATLPWFITFAVLAVAFCLTMGMKGGFPFFLLAGASLASAVVIARDSPFPFNALFSTLILGFSMAAMLLGHWYLVQPKLSIKELSRISLILIILIIARFAWGSYMMVGMVEGKSEAEIYRYFFSSTVGIFLLMRWCWGLLGPLLLCYFIWGTVRIRSTQSATGILYVVVLAILTGETLSQYLALFHGIAC